MDQGVASSGSLWKLIVLTLQIEVPGANTMDSLEITTHLRSVWWDNQTIDNSMSKQRRECQTSGTQSLHVVHKSLYVVHKSLSHCLLLPFVPHSSHRRPFSSISSSQSFKVSASKEVVALPLTLLILEFTGTRPAAVKNSFLFKDKSMQSHTSTTYYPDQVQSVCKVGLFR